ncbi:zwei Ig domain protein zig-8-like [Arctopsyche grandis]|uniref:zwei Ig domain protein zig-8-like n=1 Tax=Arctopsyche grandis TaxID=121162 RepID=UPI00406D8E26
MGGLMKYSIENGGWPGGHHPQKLSWILSTWMTILLLISLCTEGTSFVAAGASTGGRSNQNSLSPSTSTRGQPYFDAVPPRNVTALLGKSAYLSCKVKNLGNKTVSWIRDRDLHILTVGSYTYSSDQRFQTTHHKDSGEWTLQIKFAQQRDAGKYECQIPTQPTRSYFVNLNVVVPTATILGGPDLHVDKGSTINLTCSIRFSPEAPAYIFWYHHDEVISIDSSRGGVSVVTERGDVTTSRLLVQSADLPDSGKYSCSPSNAEVASIRVHVLNGEKPAAMQTGSAGLSSSARHILPLLLLLVAYQKLWNLDR